MPHKFKDLVGSFFAHAMTTQVKELYSSNLILNFAVSLINIFEPVFLYLIFLTQYGSVTIALKKVLIFYLAVYLVYFAILPLGAKFAKRFGYEHSIATGTVFMVMLYWFIFGGAQRAWMIPLAIIAYAISKALYWPAYHGDFARFSSTQDQGRELSNLTVLASLVSIFGPLLGGFIAKFYGFQILFILVSIAIILSNIPMLITKEVFVPSSFSYFDAYKRIFKSKYRRQFLAHLGFGEELVALTIWPIFMYIIVKDFLGLGVLSAISLAVTMILSLYIGRATDSKGGMGVMRAGTIFYFFSWLFRVITRGVLGIFMIDAFSRVAKNAIAIPFTAVTYEKARETSIMKAVIFFEMSLVVGKIITLFGCLVLLEVFTPGWNAMFILGGVMTLFYLLF